ncbi:MAG: SUMF1/EgtB/PvdO family nonheme iron enzyme [Desulfocapsaceae bacterium]|nr:SUMF1/EgtB/PvdO family nonheme iron enzyme [Desulfocapsaceae bacterium]
MKENVASTLLLIIMVLGTAPSAAMMHGMDGQMHGGHMRQGPSEQSQQTEQDRQLGHRHGDYYHSHEGGNLPHSHDQSGAAIKSGTADKKAASPLETETSRKTEVHSQQETVKPAEQTGTIGQTGSIRAVEEPTLPTVRQGRDDMVMHLIPGGKFTSPKMLQPKGAGEIQFDSFYMDETPVTNHQYVEFLNRVLADLTVENGVVRGRNENIWLLLREVEEGYEPIVYVDGKFLVQGAHHAACAVLRVTAYGASAYTKFFGKRLPTELEWVYAASNQDVNGGNVLPIPSPVMLYPANDYGIRGLNSNIGEWTTRQFENPDQADTGKEFIVLGGISQDGKQKSELSAGVRRYPWEAFAYVGFRCVEDAHQQQQKPSEGQN